jgi:hypothetical protein
MRDKLVVAGSSLLLVLAFWTVGAGSMRSVAQVAPAAKKHFLVVGKTYEFHYPGFSFTTKVVEEPRDGGVVAESMDGNQPRRLWINLATVQFIYER